MSYLEIKNLSKTLKGRKILDDISLKFDRGKIYGIKGRNASGKTMLFRAISGLMLPSEGTITINGQQLGKDISFPPSMGLILEYPGFLPYYTGYRNLEILAKIKNEIGKEEIKRSLEDVGLDPADKRTFKKYSLGMKQRLGIAQALMENPDLIILDEPYNALDLESVQKFKELLISLKEQNKLILVTSHDKEELEFLADEIITIDQGKIIKG